MKKKLQIGIILIGIVVLGTGAWVLKHRQDQKNAEQARVTMLCGTDSVGKDLKDSKYILDPSKASLLKPFSEKVEALKDHEKSANCMYVLAAYNAYASNYTKAKDYYAKLQTLKSSGNQVDDAFKEKLATLDKYMKLVDEKQQQYKDNTFSSGPGIVDPKVGQNAQ